MLLQLLERLSVKQAQVDAPSRWRNHLLRASHQPRRHEPECVALADGLLAVCADEEPVLAETEPTPEAP